MNDEELRDQLDSWGNSSSPPVDNVFADNLETSLRVAAADRNGHRTRPIWQPLAGIVTVAVIVLAGFIALDGARNGDGHVILLSASQDSLVMLPDGTRLDSPSALDLPDGTRIEVGPDGSASVGDVVLEGGSVAEIIDGQVEVLTNPTDATPPSRSSTTTEPPSDTRPSTTAPPTTSNGTATSQTDRTTTTTTPPTTRSTEARPIDIQVVLWVTEASPSQTLLEWSATGADGIMGWEVRAGRGDRVTTVAVLRDPSARRLTVVPPDRGSMTYVVIARGRGGTTVAESNPVTVG